MSSDFVIHVPDRLKADLQRRQQKIVDLPLNGRDYNQLALLSPGVLSPTPRMSSIGFKGAINVNGNRLFMNVFLLDGVDNISYSNSFRGDNVQVEERNFLDSYSRSFQAGSLPGE